MLLRALGHAFAFANLLGPLKEEDENNDLNIGILVRQVAPHVN